MRTPSRILACIAISGASLMTTALPAAADAVCGPAPSAPKVFAVYPGPMPGDLDTLWNASEPCIGDGGTLQYDVYTTMVGLTLQPVAAPIKVDHRLAGDTQPPGVYLGSYPAGFTSCHDYGLIVTVYAWSVTGANRSAPGDSNLVKNPAYAPESLCPGPVGS